MRSYPFGCHGIYATQYSTCVRCQHFIWFRMHRTHTHYNMIIMQFSRQRRRHNFRTQFHLMHSKMGWPYIERAHTQTHCSVVHVRPYYIIRRNRFVYICVIKPRRAAWRHLHNAENACALCGRTQDWHASQSPFPPIPSEPEKHNTT